MKLKFSFKVEKHKKLFCWCKCQEYFSCIVLKTYLLPHECIIGSQSDFNSSQLKKQNKTTYLFCEGGKEEQDESVFSHQFTHIISSTKPRNAHSKECQQHKVIAEHESIHILVFGLYSGLFVTLVESTVYTYPRLL